MKSLEKITPLCCSLTKFLKSLQDMNIIGLSREFAYKKISFGLCNALATFERPYFDKCLCNLNLVLKIFGHKVSLKGIKMDPAKVEAFYRRFVKDFSKNIIICLNYIRTFRN
ncbi:hypothetical protein CR513_52333, partial [Mucuna pruriens]